ncbi:hypothetical protein DRJ17_02435 [Candidatus Woesearchaeota archaeon]|nr:MAG: hypothetical protein DRJ17_02435 [Candidatus Woesearchaeota archaeon]
MEEKQQPKLKRALSFRMVLFMTLNSLIGGSVLFLPPIAARLSWGASLLALGIVGFLSIYISMCFAELVSMFPKVGGTYEYCKQAYGRFPSFIIGWTAILAYGVTSSLLIVAAIKYIIPFETLTANLIVMAISIMFIIGFYSIVYKGVKESAWLVNIFSFIMLGTLLMIILPGAFHVNLRNLVPFFPPVFSIGTLFVTIFFISEMFFGWEDITFLAEETENAEKVIPKAIILGTVISIIFSLVFSFILLTVIHPKVLGEAAAPLKTVATSIGYSGLLLIIFSLIVYVALIGGLASQAVSSPRLVLALARDKLFPRTFSNIHQKYKTPYKAILFMAVLTCGIVILGIGSIRTLVEMLVPIELTMYSLVILSVTILRYKMPDHPRHYKAPLGKIIPVLIVMINIVLIFLWVKIVEHALFVFLVTISLIGFCLPIYLLVNVYYNPSVIRAFSDRLAFLTYLLENVLFPWGMRKKLITLIGSIRGKKILEYGCNVGTLTLHLAKAVLPSGKVYATSHSMGQIKIAHHRVTKKGHTHVKFLYDEQHHKRVHPVIPEIDAVVSVGTLSTVQNIDAVMQGWYKRLPIGGKIFVVEYDRFFHLIRNVEWLETDEKIASFFRKAGFAVKVERKWGLFWQYIYIYGFKIGKRHIEVPVI